MEAHMTMTITLEDLIKEARRELALRANVYKRKIEAREMTRAAAVYHYGAMQKIHDELEELARLEEDRKRINFDPTCLHCWMLEGVNEYRLRWSQQHGGDQTPVPIGYIAAAVGHVIKDFIADYSSEDQSLLIREAVAAFLQGLAGQQVTAETVKAEASKPMN
jgi:hypothetical protein